MKKPRFVYGALVLSTVRLCLSQHQMPDADSARLILVLELFKSFISTAKRIPLEEKYVKINLMESDKEC